MENDRTSSTCRAEQSLNVNVHDFWLSGAIYCKKVKKMKSSLEQNLKCESS